MKTPTTNTPLRRDGTPYPTPTRGAMDRAEFHFGAAQALEKIANETWRGSAAYLRLFREEARRHVAMLRRYRDHYGPHAHI